MVRPLTLVAVATLGIAAQASSVAAQANLYGSDTMATLVKQTLVAAGIQDSQLHYAGTGTGQGSKAMLAGDSSAVPVIVAQSQQISPMTRFLSDAECGSTISAGPGTGLMVGLDAIGLFTSSNAGTTGCTTLRNSGAIAGTSYTFGDWRDPLRLLYTGESAHTTAAACSATPAARAPATAGTIVGRCDSAERKALISNWNNLFQDGGCAAGTCPAGLRHAFRRDDSAATTDVFLETLGLQKTPTTGSPLYTTTNRIFCNGNESEDLDPVRTLCDDNEDVCQAQRYTERSNFDPNGAAPPTTNPATNPAAQPGDLGVVLAVTMPTNLAVQFGPACTFGKFAYAKQPFNANTKVQICPEGNPWQFQSCLYPQVNGQYNCLSLKSTRPGIRNFTNMDGRVYNLKPLDPATGAQLINPASGTGDPRFLSSGAYRIHQTHKMANAGAGSTVCTQTNAATQIACLVDADPCTLAYEGRGALDWQHNGTTPIKALKLKVPDGSTALGADSVPGTQAVADDPVTQCATYGARYPLARGIWMTSSKGFGNFTTFTNISDGPLASGVSKEKTYMTWIAGHKANWDAALQANDFIPVPGLFRQKTCVSATQAN